MITNPHGASTFHQLLRKLFVNFFMDYQSRGCGATLTRRAECTPEGAFNCEVNVGIVHDDDDILAAHFQRADGIALRAG
jgi:hypothetical protein